MMTNESAVLETALLAAHILLENGAEISRVEETFDRICRHYGVNSGSAFVLSNGIFATTGDEHENFFAKVQHIPVSATHLNRVAAVNQLSREMEDGLYTIEALHTALLDINSMSEKKALTRILASGLGSGVFCCLFGGDLMDSVSAFMAGSLLYIYLLYIGGPHLSKIVCNIGGGALVTLVCGLSYLTGFGHHLNFMIIGSIMPMVPGVSFTNGIRDIANSDYIAGSVRLLDAMLVFFGIAIGLGLALSVLSIFSGGLVLSSSMDLIESDIPVKTLCAAIGTIAFSVLFSVPRHYYPQCGLIGGAGWLAYSLLINVSGDHASVLIATMIVILLSRIAAVKEKCPVTVFMITGLFPLVPGAGIFWTTYYIVTEQLSPALSTGYSAIKTAAAIVLGIILIFELPQRFFSTFSRS